MLTDVQIRKAKPAEKAYKLSDSGGLFLQVAKSGSKLWRLKYRFRGKEKLLSIGAYPDVSLVEARAAASAAKDELKLGRDPSAVKKLKRLAITSPEGDTFEAIAREWFELQKAHWVERHAKDVIDSLESDVFPKLGLSLIHI